MEPRPKRVLHQVRACTPVSGGLACLDQLPFVLLKCIWPEDVDSCVLAQREQVLVSRDDALCFARERRSKHRVIIGIAAHRLFQWDRLNDDEPLTKQRKSVV